MFLEEGDWKKSEAVYVLELRKMTIMFPHPEKKLHLSNKLIQSNAHHLDKEQYHVDVCILELIPE
jgi:hypothetical protein